VAAGFDHQVVRMAPLKRLLVQAVAPIQITSGLQAGVHADSAASAVAAKANLDFIRPETG
jgi:hypothetical protein